MRIGVDLQSISRFTRIGGHPRFRRLVFTRSELVQADDLGPERRAEHLAGRFCAKEATCKVLGRGFGQGLHWRDIEVFSDRWGAPHVNLTGGARLAADEAGLSDVIVSLTHQCDLVIALAVGLDAARGEDARRSARG